MVGYGYQVFDPYSVQASNEFELDGQQVVLIDTPELGSHDAEPTRDIGEFLATSYVKS